MLINTQKKISSGTKIIDDLLEGGYEKKVLSVIYGPPGAGKTTVCLMALNYAAKGNKTIFIDTEGGFSPERLQQLIPETKKIYDNLIIFEPTNFKKQDEILSILDQLVDDQTKMIICDTLTGLYRTERTYEKEKKESFSLLTQHASKLLEISREKNIPIVVTTQVYTNFDNQTKMIAEDLLNYRSKCVIELTNDNGKRKAILQKHKYIPKSEKEYVIKNEGMVEV